MTKPDVILEVLQQMAVDATDATHLIERAYAAGLREGERKASANITEGLAVARAELSLCSLSQRIDDLAATTNQNMANIAKALSTEFEDDDDDYVPVLDIDDLLAEQARNNEAMIRSAIAELLAAQ